MPSRFAFPENANASCLLIEPPTVTRKGASPVGVNTDGLRSGWLCAIEATFCCAWSSRLYVNAITRHLPLPAPAAPSPAAADVFAATTAELGLGLTLAFAAEFFAVAGALSCTTGPVAEAAVCPALLVFVVLL